MEERYKITVQETGEVLDVVDWPDLQTTLYWHLVKLEEPAIHLKVESEAFNPKNQSQEKALLAL